MEQRLNHVAVALRNGIPDDFPNSETDFDSNVSLPLSIFGNELSGLEAITKYLKEIGYRFCDIAKLIGRDDRTIWDAYTRACEKEKDSIVEESDYYIPIEVFNNRILSILESLAMYLNDELNMKYCKIANFINKDQRTIWTVCNRAKKKLKNVQNA